LYFRDPEVNRVEIYLDTPWHVEQPYLDQLDLSLSDEAIHHITEQRLNDNPSRKPMQQWQHEMAERITPQ
jgi:catechol 2,3-dioxygenase